MAFCKHTLLLDDCLYALQATFPQLTRSSLRRCLTASADCLMSKATGQRGRSSTPIRLGRLYLHSDRGIQFGDLPKNRQGPIARFRGHPFDRLCFVHGIEHRLTKPNHPWTNGQVERMNRTIKGLTPTNTSANSGRKPQIDLLSTLSTQCWDDTPRPLLVSRRHSFMNVPPIKQFEIPKVSGGPGWIVGGHCGFASSM